MFVEIWRGMHQYVNGPIFFFGKWIRKKEKEKAEEETEKKKEDRREEWKWEVITNNGNEWVGKRAE